MHFKQGDTSKKKTNPKQNLLLTTHFKKKKKKSFSSFSLEMAIYSLSQEKRSRRSAKLDADNWAFRHTTSQK